jgi:2-aminoethylphosphonate transport system permease protein
MRKGAVISNLNLAAVVIVVLGPLVIYPLICVVQLSLTGAGGFSLQSFVHFFTDPGSLHLVWTTLWVMTVAAGLSSLVGIGLAGLLFFFPMPGSTLLIRFLELFVAFPSFLVAFALIFLYGSDGSVSIALQDIFNLSNPPLDFLFGVAGVILAEVMYYTPFVVRPTLASLATLDLRMVEAASSLGAPPSMVARNVVLPLALPGIAAGVILCFLLSLNEFGILLVLGSTDLVTLPVSIYSTANNDQDLQTASAEAVVMLVLSIGLYVLYRTISRRSPAAAR